MLIELKGGPYDGSRLQGPDKPDPFIVATRNPERPVYRCSCCECCACELEVVEYFFIGYENQFEKL